MGILIFAIVVILIAALIVWAIDYAAVKAPFGRIIQALVLVVAALAIANRAGVF
jgi:hypothetical protein